MVGFCERVREDTENLDRESFVSDRRTYDAVRLNLILLGEAAGNVPEAVRSMHSEIPWRTIVATRNRLIHGYPGVDDGIVWGIVNAELPVLQPVLKQVLETPTQHEEDGLLGQGDAVTPTTASRRRVDEGLQST